MTTVPKAKLCRIFTEKMITYGKKNTIKTMSLAHGFVRGKPMVRKLFQEIAPRYQYRTGGYTRIIKTGYRHGDMAPLCYIELVDRPGELRQATPVNEESYKTVENMRKAYEARQIHV